MTLDVEGWFEPAYPATSYTYNGDGLRESVTPDLTSGHTGATTYQQTWDVNEPLPLLLGDGTEQLIYGPNDAPLEQITSTGAIQYFGTDQYGSTRILTDQTGTVVATYSYSPYGTLDNHTGSADTPLRWNGQYQDKESGLYYLRARYYDPTTSQFLAPDPLSELTQQTYQYTYGDPIATSDPTGLGCGFLHQLECITSAWHQATSGTVGWCLGASSAAAIGVAGSFCISDSQLTHPGVEINLGGGGGSPSASVWTGPMWSNATDPAQLKGWFGYGGGSVTIGPDVGISAGATGFIGLTDCNQTITGGTAELGFTADFPFPFEVHGGGSYTWVILGG